MNNYQDRKMMKWQPFDSLGNSALMKKELAKKKLKKEMPILSEDQLNKINTKIQEAYFNFSDIKITYFFNNNIITKRVKIKKIDYNLKQLILSDNTKLFYKQVIDVKNN